MNDFEFSKYCHEEKMKNFKSKDHWALSWVEDFMIPSEKELDNIENESALRRLVALAKKQLNQSEGKDECNN